ncbi:ribonuclease HII [Halonatronum saccharophilum]|uniref:ribonuclease HII n=1 Tax=Halonatronum saccharophilum TaxID=150060 RepID=UPI000486E4D9|nr:ribonuclease HII [Halonatronum saccharophilum]
MDFASMTIKEIKEAVSNLEVISDDLIEKLALDSRKGVQKISSSILKARKREQMLKEKFEQMSRYEKGLRERGYKLIGGIDEAGRGPLAGPVVAAVVILDEDTYIPGLDDSKKLSESKREELFEIIQEKALGVGVGIVDNRRIDEINILQATYQGMKEAISSLEVDPDYLLIDAETLPGIAIAQKGIVEGDANSVSIAAASIVAKVTRDRMLLEYDKEYPEYGFSSHKGYGTAYHIEALKEHGPTPIHRKSFKIVSKFS